MAMQDQAVRFISRRGENFDHCIQTQVDQVGFGVEWDYYGIADPVRSDDVRRGLRRAGRRLGVAVKAYPAECNGCRAGGPECRVHIKFTSYDPADAKRYMAAKARALNWGKR